MTRTWQRRFFYGTFLTLAGIVPIAQAKTCTGIEVTASTLNVRTGPATSNSKVGEINAKEQYVLTSSSGDWRKIWYNTSAQWIYATGYTKTVSLNCGSVVNTTSLNVRSGPGTGYRIVGSIPKSSQWAILGEDNGWLNIWFESESRWVSGSYLDGAAIAPIAVTRFNINNNAASTTSPFVSIFQTAPGATYYQLSENSSFTGASWQSYVANPKFTLSTGNGSKQLFFRVKNADGRISTTVSDSINLQVPEPAARSIVRTDFYQAMKTQFGALNQSQVDGLNYLLDNIEKDKEPAVANRSTWAKQIAYMLATTKHEVANTYQPITEYGNTTCQRYDGGCTYKGRGYVQLTHQYNYAKMSPITGVDLVANPTLALQPNVAYRVMSYGMFYGSFTGKKLGSYVNAGVTDYYNARRVINGTDKASLIQGYASKFQSILDKTSR